MLVTNKPLIKTNVAVLLPCKNEAKTVEKVVKDFSAALPDADIYVYDNNSDDDTVELAQKAGAITGFEMRPGKGNVIRRMFSEIEADIYVMADGDATYDAASAPMLIDKLLATQSDMVVGTRIGAIEHHSRAGHGAGNRIFNHLFTWIFGDEFTDIFSGYRVFSRRFVKSFPALSAGFEIETELSAHASQLRLPVCEIALPYYERPEGSESKLSTFGDGVKILKAFVILAKEYKPIYFFGLVGLLGLIFAGILSIPLFREFSQTGHVQGIAMGVLCTGIGIVSMLSVTAGVILDSIRRFRAETRRLIYNLN